MMASNTSFAELLFEPTLPLFSALSAVGHPAAELASSEHHRRRLVCFADWAGGGPNRQTNSMGIRRRAAGAVPISGQRCDERVADGSLRYFSQDSPSAFRRSLYRE
jgi:hypothetical protein